MPWLCALCALYAARCFFARQLFADRGPQYAPRFFAFFPSVFFVSVFYVFSCGSIAQASCRKGSSPVHPVTPSPEATGKSFFPRSLARLAGSSGG
jgi:hypothetical protein